MGMTQTPRHDVPHMCTQASITYASNTGNATSVSYPHYEVELGFSNGITPAFMTSYQQNIPCAYCWGALYALCAFMSKYNSLIG